jgi:mannose-1-phosphate guanylyltransferase
MVLTTVEEAAEVTGLDPETSAEAVRRGGETPGKTHVLILAGGEGTRLRELTRPLAGDDRPKQFVALFGRQTLLDLTRRRASLLVPPERTHLVLTRPHEPYYRPLASELPPDCLVVQPENRGTAAAVLYAALRVARQSPDARLVFLPSDHWVSDDAAFVREVSAAVSALEEKRLRDRVILLGIAPTRPEEQYGWIEPADALVSGRPIRSVGRFVEKPPLAQARRFQARGYLWNSLVTVARAEALIDLFLAVLPSWTRSFLALAETFGTWAEDLSIARLYREMPATDFSADVLAAAPERLAVLPVWRLLWDDLGNPARVLAIRASLARGGPARTFDPARPAAGPANANLA